MPPRKSCVIGLRSVSRNYRHVSSSRRRLRLRGYELRDRSEIVSRFLPRLALIELPTRCGRNILFARWLEPIIKGFNRDAQNSRGLGFVTASTRERALHKLTFDLFERHADPQLESRVRSAT